mmetsp:Transcript_117923/g.375949  ORF Transcript_117923/g.375949 Transcript_117923/m.375949 type:complete len:220 (+) Transcript_117923:4027-4686(+)
MCVRGQVVAVRGRRVSQAQVGVLVRVRPRLVAAPGRAATRRARSRLPGRFRLRLRCRGCGTSIREEEGQEPQHQMHRLEAVGLVNLVGLLLLAMFDQRRCRGCGGGTAVVLASRQGRHNRRRRPRLHANSGSTSLVCAEDGEDHLLKHALGRRPQEVRGPRVPRDLETLSNHVPDAEVTQVLPCRASQAIDHHAHHLEQNSLVVGAVGGNEAAVDDAPS